MRESILNAEKKSRAYTVGAAVAGSLLSLPVSAADLSISTARTTPAVTSNADGTGPGNIGVTSAGSVAVTSGAAVTLDSSNTVTNAGAISNSGESFAIGVRITTTNGDIAGALTNSGTINVPGPATTSALYNSSVTNTGIQVDGQNTFKGSITQNTGATLSVGGNGSTGILTNARIDGSIVNNGKISMAGNAALGMAINSALTGGLTNAGTIEGPGQATIGIYAGGNISGAITNTGSITTGTAAGSNVTTNPLLAGGRALWVAGNAGGLLLEGNGVTAAQGGAGNGLTDSTLSVIGGAEALYIGPGGSANYKDIAIGTLTGDPDASSLLIRGNITSQAASAVSSIRAVNITGVTTGGVDYHVTFAGALRNAGGEITASGIDTPVNALRIGELTTIPSIVNSGAITATARDSSEDVTTGAAGYGGGDATAITIDARANVASFVNSGVINAESHGATQSAYAVIDTSGTLTSIDNSGAVYASVKGTGAATAFDLSKAATPVTFRNSGSIIGDILLGAGNNDFASTAGGISGTLKTGAGADRVAITNTLMTGNLVLGAGANTVTLTNSTLTGGISADGGTVALDMSGSTLSVPATQSVRVASGRITGASTVNFNINSTAGLAGTIVADGAFSVGAGATLNAVLTGPVKDQLTVNLIQAQTLVLGTDLSAQQPASTIMYAKRIALAADNHNILQYQVTRNTAAQLGLTSDLGKVYEAVVPALATDTGLSTALGDITARGTFTTALGQLMPDVSDASRIAALNAINLSQTAVRRRMEGLSRSLDEPLGRYRSSVWAQVYGTYGTQNTAQNAAGTTVPGYRVVTGGLAAGVDGELDRNWLGGVSISQTESYMTEKDNVGRKSDLSTTAFEFYTRANLDPLYIQGIVGYAYDSHSSTRDVTVVDVARTAESDWTGNQLSTAIDAGTTLPLGNARLVPYLRGAYARIFQQAHKETGAGDGANLTYVHRITTSLRAGGGAAFQYQTELGDLSLVTFEARGDVAHEFKAGAPVFQTQFTAGTAAFTVQGVAPARETLTGGVGLAWNQKFSTWSLDYDAQKAGGYLGHNLTLTYRARF